MTIIARLMFPLLALCIAACSPAAPERPDFEAAWRAHTAAVSSRDLAALEPTLTTGDDLILIFPGGTMTRTKDEFLDFHREWFAIDTWTMTLEPIWSREAGDTAQVLFRTRYTDVDEAGAPVETSNFLLMTFELQDGAWRLVTDQNTRVAPEI